MLSDGKRIYATNGGEFILKYTDKMIVQIEQNTGTIEINVIFYT